MSEKTYIEWTDSTWQPITGCSVVSPGCTNCYAMRLAGTRLRHIASRKGLTTMTKAGPVWNGEVRFNEDWLPLPLDWQAPRRVFVCAHGDLFHEAVPDEWIDSVFAVMALARWHTFQVLTKRADRMRAYMSRPPGQALAAIDGVARELGWTLRHDGVYLVDWPLPNVWLGVSAERQQEADERVPDLLATPAAVRFVSAEPLLGPIDFSDIPLPPAALVSMPMHEDHRAITESRSALREIEGSRIDWIIVGGESGHSARPMHPKWARDIRDQCAAAGVPFFFKQWGEWADVPSIPADALDRYYQPESDPDAARRFKPKSCVLHPDGTRTSIWAMPEGDARRGADTVTMLQIGKRNTGRLLDGVEWSQSPPTAHEIEDLPRNPGAPA